MTFLILCLLTLPLWPEIHGAIGYAIPHVSVYVLWQKKSQDTSIGYVIWVLLSCPTGDTPTLLNLKMMEAPDGLNVVQKIAAGDYTTFGMHLLHDENGGKVELIKRDHRHDSTEGITDAILRKWLTDGPSRTYEHLIACLRKCKLGALADDIAKRTTQEGRLLHSTCTH